MFEIINGILEGNYIHESGSLDFSCAKIEISLMQGEQVSGSFRIMGDKASMISGSVLSTDYRMEVKNQEFTGSEAEISYVLHGEAMEEGEAVKGAFRVISNQGEYSLPFVGSCEHSIPKSSLGPIKNLFHFTNLAKSDWQEALQLFYSPDFEKILTGADSQYLAAYQGLSAYGGQEQNMEEFLIHVGKKQNVEFRAETASIDLEMLPVDGEYQLTEQEITIVKNGWGYTVLNVECEGAFLFSEKELITEDDFLGNYARIPVYIDRTYLKQGVNRGRVSFYNSFVCLDVEVSVKLGTEVIWDRTELSEKKLIAEMMEKYEDFRTKKLGLAGWLKETGQAVEKLITLNEEDPIPRLFKAQLLITGERENEADWLLAYAKDLMEAQGGVSDEVWAYYLYLTSLLSRDPGQIDLVAEEVEGLFRQNPDSWRIAWLVLYLSEEYIDSPEKKIHFLGRQYERGCYSSVLYLEALQVYQSNPALLKKLDDFELQVLFYGARKENLGQELVERILEVLEKRKDYSPVLCRLLEKLYEKRQDGRIVQAMCQLLLKGGVSGERALPWYEKGVEQQLRLTNLYEAFLSSVDPETRKGLPKAAVLYFAYQNKLDYERQAFLYDYVLDNKVLYAEVYDKYLALARSFVQEQIEKGRINRHLANLYSKLFTPEMISEQNAASFVKLLFSARLRGDDQRYKKVILYYHGSVRGAEYPLTDGEAIVPAYGNESAIVFEDTYGNRFIRNDDAELEKYMLSGKYLSELMKYDTQCPEFDLFLIREKSGGELWGEEQIQRALKLCNWEFIAPDLKKQLSLMLLRLFYENGREEELQDVIRMVSELELGPDERREVIRYLVLSGKYEQAYGWIAEFGPYFPDANTLARLLSNLIVTRGDRDQVILAAAVYLFHRGKANGTVLAYLNQWAEGSCKELRDIWKGLKNEGVDTSLLEERLLVQLLYTGSFVGEKREIFESYYDGAGMTDVARAFVIQSAYEFFVRERVTDARLIQAILDEQQAGQPIPKVCKLAFLKYYSDNPQEIDRAIDSVLEEYLREMMAEKLHFGFFRNFRNHSALLGELADKVFVEYRTGPGGKARIHYVITRENGEEQDYLSENMRDVFEGICCREFVLFFGETLQYYVTEEVGGEETLTESGNLQCPDLENDVAGSKFGLVNDLVISNSLQDYDTLDKDLETYYFREYCGETLFQLM